MIEECSPLSKSSDNTISQAFRALCKKKDLNQAKREFPEVMRKGEAKA